MELDSDPFQINIWEMLDLCGSRFWNCWVNKLDKLENDKTKLEIQKVKNQHFDEKEPGVRTSQIPKRLNSNTIFNRRKKQARKNA